MNTLNQVGDFLSKKRIAFIGVSRNEKDFTRLLFREMHERGYDVIPVNPNASEIDGMKCFSQINEVLPKAEAALILTPSMPLEEIVSKCRDAGINNIWVYNGRDKEKNTGSVEAFCSANNINFIVGYCPFMFLKDTSFIHRFHGFFARLSGSYPA